MSLCHTQDYLVSKVELWKYPLVPSPLWHVQLFWYHISVLYSTCKMPQNLKAVGSKFAGLLIDSPCKSVASWNVAPQVHEGLHWLEHCCFGPLIIQWQISTHPGWICTKLKWPFLTRNWKTYPWCDLTPNVCEVHHCMFTVMAQKWMIFNSEMTKFNRGLPLPSHVCKLRWTSHVEWESICNTKTFSQSAHIKFIG